MYTIRPYQAGDDSSLMAIEYQSPRGASDPFVHYRKHFIDRARLFSQHELLVLASAQDEAIGCVGIAFKQTQVARESVTLAYLFDLRIAPAYRRQGLGSFLVAQAEAYAWEHGALGAYGLIVSVNLASLRLFDKHGYTRIRQVLYLEYPPMQMDMPPALPIACDSEADWMRYTPATDRDLYVADVIEYIQSYDYGRWFHDSNFGYAGLSVYEQSQIYRQISPDDLRLPEAVLRQQSRCLRLFHPIGAAEAPEIARMVFDTVRDHALATNDYRLNLVVDAEEALPGFFFTEAEHQKRYWLTFRSLHSDFNPQWGSPLYIDPREI